ncbi:MAG TPA: 2-oxoglutarate dehydrogenase, E2 component, dihydrolipoamide succinyltransferase [Thermoanaerobaculia bacterium]|nr:2-oxoglutarate dehydrogenase, E2 component, dihydrolipoamide succinyltransferase [Thermoanaerobaculia bacterium]
MLTAKGRIMAAEVIMPQMGESIAEGTITKWLKKVGDPVKRDEPIFEISTDKVDAEIPSPVAGTLLEIKVPEGQTVAINTIVAMIGEAGEKPASAPAAAPAPAAAAPVPATLKPEAKPEPRPAPAPAPPPPPAAPAPAPPISATGRVESFEERVRQRSSPLVRKIAAEHGVQIGEIEGTGIHSRVTKNDILSYIENRKTGAAAPAVAAAAPASVPAAEPSAPSRPALATTDRDEVVAMSKIRKITAENMTLSKRTSAHVTTVFHVDYTNVARLRDQNKQAFLAKNGVKLTYLPFIFRSVIQALKEFPQVNASIDGDNIVYHKDVHLGMAVALDWGLIVPVIKNADEKSILGLARATQDLAERARSKRLKPEEIQGGTFTVTNPGMFGSLFGTPIIPQPQVAILGVGTIEKRPVVVADEQGNDALGIRTVGYLALSFDHRLIDGADADKFMASVKKTLEKGEFDLG